MDSQTYWKNREMEQRKHNIRDEKEYQKHIQEIYQNMIDEIEKEINGFYGKYAKKEGITITEARKRAAKADIEALGRKAAKYVKEKNFSQRANEEMRLYNLTMKVNRLELLKAQIGLEMAAGFDELQKYYEEILTDRALAEFERQAGILGKTIQNNAKAANAIVNASFHNATFSDRIWMYQDMLKNELSSLLQTGLIQGQSSRRLATHLRKRFGVSQSNAERLMTTELRRVQTEAARQSYEVNGNVEYRFLAINPMGACPICRTLDGKVFKVEKMMPGTNAPPMHPRCHCATAPYWDEAAFNDWLETDTDMEFAEWNRLKKKEKKDILEIDDKGDLYTDLKDMSDDLAERSLQVNHYLNTLNLPKSKWSGITKVVTAKELPKAVGRTKVNGDILLRNDASIKTIIHEHLHTRSVLNNRAAYRENKWFEENACEMLAEEICNKSGITYKRTYKNVTEPLRDIAGITSQYISDYEFALDYFNVGLENREQWLVELANKETDSSVRGRILDLIGEIKNAKRS